jgi:hypothetical protein
MRRLLARTGGLVAGENSNVTSQDETQIVKAATSAYLPASSRKADHEVDVVNVVQDHAYCTKRLEPLVENVVVYIAGWTIKKALQTISCDLCRSSLVSTTASTKYHNSFLLLNIKNCGGLTIPSDGVIEIIMSAERHLRQITTIHKVQRSATEVLLRKCVLADVGADCLHLSEHALSTSLGIENHYFDVVTILISIFFKLRYHHIVRLHNMYMRGRSIRQKCTKLVLFKGQ